VYPVVAVTPEALWSQLELRFIFAGEMSVRMIACLSAVQKIAIHCILQNWEYFSSANDMVRVAIRCTLKGGCHWHENITQYWVSAVRTAVTLRCLTTCILLHTTFQLNLSAPRNAQFHCAAIFTAQGRSENIATLCERQNTCYQLQPYTYFVNGNCVMLSD
jgi:hypothetical protein